MCISFYNPSLLPSSYGEIQYLFAKFPGSGSNRMTLGFSSKKAHATVYHIWLGDRRFTMLFRRLKFNLAAIKFDFKDLSVFVSNFLV